LSIEKSERGEEDVFSASYLSERRKGEYNPGLKEKEASMRTEKQRTGSSAILKKVRKKHRETSQRIIKL